MSREINLKQSLEYKGYWYLPSSPDRMVAGILTYFPPNKITLELIGSFNDSISSLLECPEEAVIYGKTSDAKLITLLNCYPSVSITFSAELPIVKYYCDFIIIGKHINSLDEKANYWTSFRIPELTLWCHPAALNNNVIFDKQEDRVKNITISSNFNSESNEDVICSVQINDNTSLLMRKDIHYDGSAYLLNPQFEQYTYIDIIKHSEVTIKELLSDIHTFERFISLASFNVVESSDITFYDKEIYQQIQSKKHYKQIHLIYRCNKPRDRGKHNRDFLFEYSTIKDVYPEIIKNWYNVPPNIYPIRNHLISSLEKKSSYNSVDFLIIIQAIEGFWWRFKDNDYRINNSISKKKNTTLNTILNELLLEYCDIEVLNNSGMDVEAIVDSRNYYSHFVEQSKKPKKLEGWLLIEQAKRLRILLICCVLSFIGFDHTKINNIFKKSNCKLI